ncbi:MAG: DUF5661 family protein, partial [Candidatus Nanopelagicales bacterium]
HKTVEQIAKKHRLSVSFIQRQLDMGEPIEHEHTKNHALAKYIALQHLDEIPDYYTRLKKMESDAKKHHKKFKDVNIKEEGLRDWFGKSKSKNKKPGWVDVVDGDACAREEGETATPKCVSSEKRASMSREERIAAQAAKRREDPNQPQKSGAAKPTMVQTDRKTRKEEMDLREVKDKPGKGSGKKDACYHKVRSRYDVWPSAYASGALVKCRKVGAANWGTKTEENSMSLNYDWDTPIRERADRYCPKCEKLETRNECKYGVKYWDMFSLPAEVISNKNDFKTTLPYSGYEKISTDDLISTNKIKYNPNRPHPANESKEPDHEHSMIRSEISTIVSAVKRLKKKVKGEGNVEAWVQSKITKAADYLDTAADYIESGEHDVGESCWPGYKRKPKTKKFSPGSCVKETYSNWREELQLNPTTFEFIDLIKPDPLQPTRGIGSDLVSEDWQKVNRKDKTDGLSQAAVNAYRRENPGSKLQTAVTEKKPKGKRAKRRANFCSRMSGMKDKLTSAKTARDPDSRINKALRRWNCN